MVLQVCYKGGGETLEVSQSLCHPQGAPWLEVSSYRRKDEHYSSAAQVEQNRSPGFRPWLLPANDVTSLGLKHKTFLHIYKICICFHIQNRKKTESDTAYGSPTYEIKWDHI